MQYYEKKGKLGKELVEKLDLLLSDRPFTLRAKRKNFVIEDPAHPQGIKRKNFYFDIEMMRINAEKDRIQNFKHIAQTCAKTYYVICKRLSLLNLEEVEHAQYILDYMRNVIESGKLFLSSVNKHVFVIGNDFNKNHIYMILDSLNQKEIKEPRN